MLWESLQNPILVRKVLIRVADQVECLAELIITHANLSNSDSCLESINIEKAILIIILLLKI